jgi:SAM-dependent methyltransferase
VQVWANDLWISATENWQRIREAGLEKQVFPVHAEAHALPYADGFFDAIVSLDAYQYFGTDDLYLNYFHKFLKPGGQIGIVVPGLTRDFTTPPEHLTKASGGRTTFWVDECWCFHTAEWWQRHWAKLSFMADVTAELLAEGVKDWIQYEKACDEAGTLMFPSEAETLEEDGGRYLALIRMVGRRK